MRIQFSVKSNTGGHFVYETNEAGRKEIHDYLVREVQYLIDDDYCEATVYVIPIGWR